MYYAVDSYKMRSIDNYSIDVLKIPSLVLMERAAYEVALIVKANVKKSDSILVVCGTGNNGGDGIAAGRILFLQGYQVAILFIGLEENCSEQTKLQLAIARNIGIHFENSNKLNEYNIIIDGIFGIGLSRPVDGEQAEIIEDINNKGFRVFSVDIPSGISADDGRIMNVAIKAEYTITFGWNKQGLLLYPGAEYAGNIIVADVGFPQQALHQSKPNTFYYGSQDLEHLPNRRPNGHKGSFGKVLVIAGSKGMSGAAYLSAKAAYKTGAGLVKVFTETENRIILQTLLPEALFAAYDDINLIKDEEALAKELDWASTIIIGPGLGQSDIANDILWFTLKNSKVPVIIDGDAINLLAKKLDTISDNIDERITWLGNNIGNQVILTPHLKELSRLLLKAVDEISTQIIDTANQCSYNNNLIYTIKDARTVVAHGNDNYINVSGNNGMATGGSGDVLTGVIGGLVAQGMELYLATCLGVYIHGLAGDKAAARVGTFSLTASDIISSLEEVLSSGIRR
ncbi:MAG: NAD(P)H-hydrate dehydratase [Clostridiales bacterium]|nr:NAD(P)H-hydrate dehydratase [Clostridiales bacterium]